MGPAGREARLHRGLLKLPLLGPSLVREAASFPPPPLFPPTHPPQKQLGSGLLTPGTGTWLLSCLLADDLQLALNVLGVCVEGLSLGLR